MKTFLNAQNEPMIRSCMSCKHFQRLSVNGSQKDEGYCKVQKLLYAYTMEESVYAIVKKFYLCASHEFKNEKKLMSVAPQIDQLDAINKKQ